MTLMMWAWTLRWSRTMVEIEVRNFQSIEHVKFQIDGFTVLVGRSNLGKSSIIRAIQCALTGASGTDFVRHGLKCERRVRGNKKCKCFAQVIIQTDALKITWEKGDAVNRYIILKAGEKETTVYDKVGQGTPEFLQPEFSPVRIGSDQNLIQVSEQFAPIFLLDQNGNVVADVLSDVARLDEINVAMGFVSKDRKAAMATRKVREKDILTLTSELEKYEGLDGTLGDVDHLEESHKVIQRAGETLDQLDGYLEKALNLSQSRKVLKTALAPPLSDSVDLEEATRKLYQVDRFYEALTSKATLFRQLKGVEKVGLPDPGPLEVAADKAVQIDSWIQRLRGFKAQILKWKDLEVHELSNPDSLTATLDRMLEINAFIDRMARLQASEDRVKALLEDAEREEQAIIEEVRELGICPTCSRNIEVDQCLHLEGS